MAIIVVTGTPGTGKTLLARGLAESIGYAYVDVNLFIRDHGLSEGRDRERDCEVVDVQALSDAIVSEFFGKDCIIDSHLAHNLPAEKVARCVVARCGLPELRRRLEARGYSKKKVRENLDAEAMDMCLTEALEAGHRVVQVRTDGKIDMERLARQLTA